MKRIASLAIFAIIAISALANPIDNAKAKSLAQKALSALSISQTSDVIEAQLSNESKSRLGLSDVEPAFYIFNTTDSAGFVIISGDDALPSVVGYSHNNIVSTDHQLPDGLRLFLEAYSRFVADVREGVIDVPFYETELEADTIVAPIVECQWGQDDPFNYYCPEGYPVGCVATAMAQIMYHYKWPESGTGKPKYTWNGKTLEVDLSTRTYNWSAMKKTAAGNRMGAARDAVAQISYDCGVATQMMYGAGGSGTYDDLAMVAFYKYFRYNPKNLKIVRRNSCNSKAEWNRLIYSELDARRPIQFSAASPVGEGGDAAGHSFVVDGYDSNGFVHVNWGWSGSGDGFYDMDVMDVHDYKFYLSQSAIVGIEPNYSGSSAQRQQYALYINPGPQIPVNADENYTPATTDEFSVSFQEVYNYSASTRVYNFGLGIYDKNGKFLDDVSVYSTDRNQLILQGFYGYSNYGAMKCKLPRQYPDGDYMFRAISKESGYDNWILAETEGGSDKNILRAYIHDGKIHFNEVSTGINGIESNTEAVKTEYFDLNGMRLDSTPAGKGVFIERTTFTDGSVKSAKRVY